MKYRIYRERNDQKPCLTVPLMFLVHLSSAMVSPYWHYFRADNSKTGKTLIEWSEPVDNRSNN